MPRTLATRRICRSRRARRFAVLTCMDARIDPAKLAGLAEGDAHVIRNAGGRASDDAIRSLVISHKLLGTREWFVIHHTDCGMGMFTDDTMRALLASSLETAALGRRRLARYRQGAGLERRRVHRLADLQGCGRSRAHRHPPHPLASAGAATASRSTAISTTSGAVVSWRCRGAKALGGVAQRSARRGEGRPSGCQEGRCRQEVRSVPPRKPAPPRGSCCRQESRRHQERPGCGQTGSPPPPRSPALARNAAGRQPSPTRSATARRSRVGAAGARCRLRPDA